MSYNLNVHVVDLHEFEDIYKALEFLETEIYRLYKNGDQFVRVIHGVGEGILKEKVHGALKNNPLIIQFELEKTDGSTIVYLDRSRQC